MRGREEGKTAVDVQRVFWRGKMYFVIWNWNLVLWNQSLQFWDTSCLPNLACLLSRLRYEFFQSITGSLLLNWPSDKTPNTSTERGNSNACLPICMLTLLSRDVILIPKYMNWFSYYHLGVLIARIPWSLTSYTSLWPITLFKTSK